MNFQRIEVRFLSNYEDNYSSFKDDLKSFILFSRVGVSCSPPPYKMIVGGSRLNKLRSGLACVAQWQGKQISRVPLT
jgi:hypothetical protein